MYICNIETSGMKNKFAVWTD